MTLARAGSFAGERGEFAGAKNVSGGVLGSDLAKLVPEYWEEEDGGWERFVNHRRLSLMDEHSFTLDFKSSHWDQPPTPGWWCFSSFRYLAGRKGAEGH